MKKILLILTLIIARQSSGQTINANTVPIFSGDCSSCYTQTLVSGVFRRVTGASLAYGKLNIRDTSTFASSIRSWVAGRGYLIPSTASMLYQPIGSYVLAQRFLDSIFAVKPVYSTYTPALTNTTNITSSTVQLTNNYRIGNISHFSASGNITPTATGAVELTFTLPVASTNTTGYTIGFGDVGINSGTSYTSGEVILVSSTTAKFRFITTSATTSSYQFSIDYNF